MLSLGAWVVVWHISLYAVVADCVCWESECVRALRGHDLLVRSLLVLWLLRWTIRGLCCGLVSGVLVPEVLMRGESCNARSPLVSSVLSVTVNNLT